MFRLPTGYPNGGPAFAVEPFLRAAEFSGIPDQTCPGELMAHERDPDVVHEHRLDEVDRRGGNRSPGGPDNFLGEGAGNAHTESIVVVCRPGRNGIGLQCRAMPDNEGHVGDTAIQEIIGSVVVARCLHVIAELGIADHVAEQPKTAQELATATGAHADSLYRVLRMLAAHGIFAEDDEHRFHLTPSAFVLRTGVRGSLRNRLRLAWQNVVWTTYGQLPYTMMTGEPAFDRANGAPLFDYLAANPEVSAAFDQAMAQISGPEDQAVAAAYDFGRHRLVVDVGGGRGGLLAAVLGRYPTVRGVLFDRAHVVSEPEYLDESLLDRCTVVAGDFFRSVPPDADAYVLKRIIHDWDDETSVALLSRCRAAVHPEGRVLVVEAVMKGGNEPDPHKAQDVGMMLLTHGRERTAAEFRSLFSRSGLRLQRIATTLESSTLSILEGVPSGGRRSVEAS